ncbi:hypothetical protein MLD38_038556 [Melastoma candidum]|uniref:Uncharacterized protein n=1 Tax=Melastoma candidum TaxID=119954 RepID=A0ACB9L0H1_9MYRT|nr:hypothetical protein MLD38_038556 [Melastoma candidum]
MATKPGVLTDWPWKPLGNFKYLILAPWAFRSAYTFLAKDESAGLVAFLTLPFLLLRMLHNQVWISLSRYRTAKGGKRIVDRGIDFDQVDRERGWDDQILFNGILFYTLIPVLPGASKLPLWRTDGALMLVVLHAGPVEFIYYWLHRALHHHYLYSRYHSHHHSSIVTEPITSVIHPFAEHIAYHVLFAFPMATLVFMGTASIGSLFGYIAFIDLMNNMGHCNFEIIPKRAFSVFPPLKYLMYTPSYHSLHHTQFRTNYSLFMPLYDYIYGTVDKSTDQLYAKSLARRDESPDVVHLTHLTTPESIYHLPLGLAYLASRPQQSKWYLWLMWPVTLWSLILTWIYSGRAFVVERHRCDDLKLQTWAIPKYSIQYGMKSQKGSINGMMEGAILDADEKGAKVLSLGLLNQAEEVNAYGGLYVERNPRLRLRIVDGSALTVAAVLNAIPEGTTRVLLRGKLNKVAYALAAALSRRGIQVATLHEHEYKKVEKSLNDVPGTNLVLCGDSAAPEIWLVGNDITSEEQSRAPKGALFIPFSLFPPKQSRKDCFYHCVPAMTVPSSLENLHSCENWLPRRAMSAWRVAAIVHAIEGWEEHECGYHMADIDRAWKAALHRGFQPVIPTIPQSMP